MTNENVMSMQAAPPSPVLLGQAPLLFSPDETWPAPAGTPRWSEVPAVAVDAQDRVFVFCRGEQPMLVFDRAGKFLHGWGEGLFARPHGLTVGPDGMLWCSDDFDHTVKKFTPEGQLGRAGSCRPRPQRGRWSAPCPR